MGTIVYYSFIPVLFLYLGKWTTQITYSMANPLMTFMQSYLYTCHWKLESVIWGYLRLGFIFKKWAIPAPFLINFCLFQQTLQFLQQICVKFLCPSSIHAGIRTHDLQRRQRQIGHSGVKATLSKFMEQANNWSHWWVNCQQQQLWATWKVNQCDQMLEQNLAQSFLRVSNIFWP